MDLNLFGAFNSSSSKSNGVVEQNLVGCLEEKSYGVSRVDVSLSLRPPVAAEHKCKFCGLTKTPLWRNGPDGPKTLCNACGIRYRKEAMKLSTALTLGPANPHQQASASRKAA